MMPEEYVVFDHVRGTITILRFLFGEDPENIKSGYTEALRQISAAKKLSASWRPLKRNSRAKTWAKQDKRIHPAYRKPSSKIS